MKRDKSESTLKERHHAYIAEARRKGKRILWLQCPVCDGRIETPAAYKGDRYSTAVLCPHCAELFFKRVTATKATASYVALRNEEQPQ